MGLGPIASQPLNSEQLELVKAQLSQLNSAQLNCEKLNSCRNKSSVTPRLRVSTEYVAHGHLPSKSKQNSFEKTS